MSKVLILGEEPFYFVRPLVVSLKERYSSLKIGLLETQPNGREDELYEHVFDENVRINIIPNLKQLLKMPFSRSFYKNLIGGLGLKESIRASHILIQVKPVFDRYDIINLHLINKHCLYYMQFIPRNKRIVFSFWGTDLLNPPETSRKLIEKYIRRANRITLHTPEMREIFLSKYGRDLINKVKVTLLVDDTKKLEEVIENLHEKSKTLEEFKRRYSIPQDKIIVTIGHSGHHVDNHLEVIKNLGFLSKEEKSRLYLVLPMTYGCSDTAYFDEIEKTSQAFGLECLIFKEYLPKMENIELRLISEIHIRVPKYDAFSLALSETICSDNIIISATWLPYSRLRISGVYYKEISEYEQLTELMSSILANFDAELNKHHNNHKAVIKMFQQENATENFYKVFVN